MNIERKQVVHESPFYRLGSPDAETAVAAVSQDVKASIPSRRREARVDEQKICTYSLCESLAGEQVTIEQGAVYCINRSEHGILVLMGGQPQKRQLLELHIAETQWEYSLNLYEVQWTKIVPVESHGDLFLAGCRLVFGASRYSVFKG